MSFIFNRWEANSGRYVLGNFLPFYLKMWCLLGQHELFFNKTCVSEFLFNIWVVTRRSFRRVFSFNLVFSIRTISYGPRIFLSDLWLARSNSAGLSVEFARTHSYFIIFLRESSPARTRAPLFMLLSFLLFSKTSNWHKQLVFRHLRAQTDMRNHTTCFYKGSAADPFRVLKKTSFIFAIVKRQN